MALIAELDLGDKHKSITALAKGIRASGNPSFSAAWIAETVRAAACGFARPTSS